MNIALAAIAQSTPTTVDQVINVFWQAFAQNLNSALGDRMEVPINISDIIGDEGVTILATRLR